MTSADAGVTVRPALPDEMGWVNGRYAETDFRSSDASHHVMIAEVGRAPAGLGRLVPMGEGDVELGGIYVLPAHRGRGVGAALVRALLAAAVGQRIWCIPWADLTGLYERAGFVRVPEEATIPEPVRAKLEWCIRHYARPVCLMQYGGAAGAP